MLIFIIELLAFIVLFTLCIVIILRHPETELGSFPPAVKKRVIKENLFEVTEIRFTKRVLARKIIASLVFVLIMALILKYINGADSFKSGFFLSYALWLGVDWYDGLIIDLYCSKSKKIRIKGTEDWDKEYDNWWYHIKQSFIGMVLGLPVALLVGLVVLILN